MLRRTCLMPVLIAATLLSCGCVLSAAAQTDSQQQTTPKPITSLPKPLPRQYPKQNPKSQPQPSPAPQPAPTITTTPADTTTPHPITSLPKPPGATTIVTVPAPAQPEPVPALAPAPITPAPAPSAPIVPTAPAPIPTPVPTAVTAPTPAPPIPAPIVVQTDAGPAPLRASLLPEAPTPTRKRFHVHPFSALAIQVKGGFAGIGIDLATPLANRINFRVGGSFYSYSGAYNADGMDIDGEAKFRSATVSFDFFPFNTAFRISPGLTVYNGNNLIAGVSVPGGQPFDLGDGSYISDPTDPIHGSGSLAFGKRVAPSLTIGAGNMIPRSGRHFSVPLEIGFQYIGRPPQISFNLLGSACGSDNMGNYGCSSIQTDPTAQANLQQEVDKINNDITFLRFYPIVSMGMAWRF